MVEAVLGLLAYGLFHAVLRALAARVRFEMQRHDIIRASCEMRLRYLQGLEDKLRAETPDHSEADMTDQMGDVELVEPEPDRTRPEADTRRAA